MQEIHNVKLQDNDIGAGLKPAPTMPRHTIFPDKSL
jgi:hypothetical protein